MPFCKRRTLPVVELAVAFQQAARLFLLAAPLLGGLLVEGASLPTGRRTTSSCWKTPTATAYASFRNPSRIRRHSEVFGVRVENSYTRRSARTSENANSAKFMILHRNGAYGMSERTNVFSGTDPVLMVAVDLPALDTLVTCPCYH